MTNVDDHIYPTKGMSRAVRAFILPVRHRRAFRIQAAGALIFFAISIAPIWESLDWLALAAGFFFAGAALTDLSEAGRRAAFLKHHDGMMHAFDKLLEQEEGTDERDDL